MGLTTLTSRTRRSVLDYDRDNRSQPECRLGVRRPNRERFDYSAVTHRDRHTRLFVVDSGHSLSPLAVAMARARSRAKLRANDRRREESPGHAQPRSSQLDAISGHARRRSATARTRLTSEGLVGSSPTAPTSFEYRVGVSRRKPGSRTSRAISCLRGARTVRQVDAASQNHVCSHPGPRRDCMTATNMAKRGEYNRVHGHRESPESRKKSNRKDQISSYGLTQGAIRPHAGGAAAHLRHVPRAV
jgi:hypothetical protein